jgi:RNA-directed DNA polymerase
LAEINHRVVASHVPTLRDRAMQALHALALQPIAETVADRNSYGFREGRACADGIGQCFCALAKTLRPHLHRVF